MGRVRVVCLIGLSILVSITLASGLGAQAESISVFGNPTLNDCNIVDNGGLVVLYVGHVFSAGAMGARFSVDVPPGWLYLGETSPFASKVGDATSGTTICYENCLANPGLVLTVNFFGAAVGPCNQVTIEPHLEDGEILALDCDWNLMSPTGGAAVVNPDGSCACHAGPGSEDEVDGAKEPENHFCAWVPVEKTTWGAIKSMY